MSVDLDQLRTWLDKSPASPENLGYALVAIAERLDTANEIAKAQVYATMGPSQFGAARAILDALD